MKHKGRRLKPASGEPGRGYQYGHHVYPRASIVFARDTFDALVGEAIERQVPLSVVVREKIAIAMSITRNVTTSDTVAAGGEVDAVPRTVSLPSPAIMQKRAA